MVDYGGGKKASHGQGESLSFSEIVGQEELKRALLAVAANDDLDGLLIQGEKGTAKSTAVRALTNLLPKQDVIRNCPYGCPPNVPEYQCEACYERTDPPTAERSVPLVTLPLGATRERVVGTLSVADALDGDFELDPGLLAHANRGILYVDEVNLLDDHLVDVILDAAASGVNRIERDGISVSHPARFTLVGTMNPEEGDLRPQLRDRFALQATVTGCEDIDQRVSIIDQAIEKTDEDGMSQMANTRVENEDFRDQLWQARKHLSEVDLSTQFAREIAELCCDSGVEGHRGDIAIARAAMTFAALDERSKVIEPDVQRAAELALPHRVQSRPFEDAPDPSELIDEHFDGEDGEGDSDEESEQPNEEKSGTDKNSSDGADNSGNVEASNRPDSPEPESSPKNNRPDESGNDTSSTDQSNRVKAEGVKSKATDENAKRDKNDDVTEGDPIVPGQSRVDIGNGYAPELAASEAVESRRASSGSRSQTQPHMDNEGTRVRSQRADSERRIDVAASVRAASTRGASSVESRDLRQSVRQNESSALVLFVVDASASMLPAMRAAKGTVLELLKDAYQKRDKVAFVAFAGDEASVLLPPTNSVTHAARHLKDLPTGDRTPLPSGLRTASDILDRAEPSASVVVLVTDGRANVADESPVRETREAARELTEFGSHVVIVDAGNNDRTGLTGLIAEETGGERVSLSSLSAERIDAAVGNAYEN